VNREQVASGLLAFLAVLALGGVAATLAASGGGEGVGTGEGEGPGTGAAPEFSLGGGYEPLDPPDGQLLPEWLWTVVGVVVLLVALYGCYELYREYDLRQLVGTAVAGAVLALGLYALLSLLEVSELGPGAGPRRGESAVPAGGSGSAAETVARTVDPPAALLAALGLVLLGAVAVIIRASGDQRVVRHTTTEDTPDTDADVTAVADAAGRAADRLDTDTGLENAVYRAWHEMTAELPVGSPETTTPAEFAEAAVEAGIDRADVAELTRLFEQVRYGAAPVTDERATRATAALRRIERTDGDGAGRNGPAEGADPTDGTGDGG
jgi:hypothetical protein